MRIGVSLADPAVQDAFTRLREDLRRDRKSTRLNSSHVSISYAVFCLKKKTLRLSPLRRCLAIYSTVDIFTFYFLHRHVYGKKWIKFMQVDVYVTLILTFNTTCYIYYYFRHFFL